MSKLGFLSLASLLLALHAAPAAAQQPTSDYLIQKLSSCDVTFFRAVNANAANLAGV